MVGFDEPVVVNHAAKGSDIDEAVEELPVLAAEAANPGFRRGDGQRDEKEKPGKADSDEGTFGDVLEHGGEVKSLVRADIGEEVQANIEEGEKAEHAAEANEIREIQEPAKRGNREGNEEKAKGPIAGRVLKKGDGFRANIGRKIAATEQSERSPSEIAERDKAEEEDNRLRPATDEELAKGAIHVSSIS